jgi:putative transposase
MARLPRSVLPDGIVHVTTRGVNGEWIYRDDEDRLDFLGDFAAVALAFGWECHALCLMGNHYHFVVTTRIRALSAGMQRLNGQHAEAMNTKYGRTGHLFGGRFVSRIVDDEPYLADVCRYVINNPVRAGLCEHPADWRWSFCRYGFELY